jgi:hypothetical protein
MHDMHVESDLYDVCAKLFNGHVRRCAECR